MKKTLTHLACAVLFGASCMASASAETVIYRFTMHLRVPRVFDNLESKGSRKIQGQCIRGFVYVDKCLHDDSGEPQIFTMNIVNNTHKVSGAKVTYRDTDASGVMWRYIGNNKTGVFKKPNVKFTLDLDPSYNIGDDEPDNTLIITLAGYGTSDAHISGRVTGQIGCGCTAYGHISPTRTLDGSVNDITPLCGNFTMRRVKTVYSCLVR